MGVTHRPMTLRKYTYYASSIVRLLAGVANWPVAVRLVLGLGPLGSQVIRLRRSRIQFRVRGAMDVWILKETYLDRFYERYGTPIGDGWTIVDVGAGIGDFSVYAALGHPQNRVYAFEPFPESLALLKENLQLNQAGNVQAFPEAIAEETGTLDLDMSSGEPLQFSTEGSAASVKTLAVPSLSLAEAFERLELGQCHVLKLDCEGAEYGILLNAPNVVLDLIEHIVMEYHDAVTPYSHGDLVEFLSSRGFDVQTWQNPVHAHLGYLYAHRQSPIPTRHALHSPHECDDLSVQSSYGCTS
jgi:FkbM family methyltransferase